MVAKSAGTAFGRAGNEEAQSKEGQRRIRNLAKAFAWWVAKSGLSLAIFKVSGGCLLYNRLPTKRQKAGSRCESVSLPVTHLWSPQSCSPT